jgi:hypothetical protein
MNPRSRATAGDAEVRTRVREPKDFTQRLVSTCYYSGTALDLAVLNGLVTDPGRSEVNH